jgi:hypothetical protein
MKAGRSVTDCPAETFERRVGRFKRSGTGGSQGKFVFGRSPDALRFIRPTPNKIGEAGRG